MSQLTAEQCALARTLFDRRAERTSLGDEYFRMVDRAIRAKWWSRQARALRTTAIIAALWAVFAVPTILYMRDYFYPEGEESLVVLSVVALGWVGRLWFVSIRDAHRARAEALSKRDAFEGELKRLAALDDEAFAGVLARSRRRGLLIGTARGTWRVASSLIGLPIPWDDFDLA